VEIIKGFFRIIRNVTCQQLGIGGIGERGWRWEEVERKGREGEYVCA
jgi:hypothetical protein